MNAGTGAGQRVDIDIAVMVGCVLVLIWVGV